MWKLELWGLLSVVLLFSGCGDIVDSKVPDTKEARNMFRKKFRFPVPESVKEIYYYSDTFRRNPKFCIACKASAETVEKIIAELKLEKDEEIRPLFLYGTPDWWSKKLEANAPSYSRRDRKKRCVYAVWHDRETERFQYAEVKY